uniref:Uncharacterized protein n=1 Tax=Arundo donax TaxID=35708 RepID=A0A0A8YES9_ARUDO
MKCGLVPELVNFGGQTLPANHRDRTRSRKKHTPFVR